jgi:hypothetical protein
MTLPPLFLCGLILLPVLASAAPPRYDHVVIVVEENRAAEQIIGDLVNCPYINNTLVAGGVSFNNMYALVHPSQPNYLHLFGGSAQGVTDDNVPAGTPFSSPNLGAALLAKGVSFLTYNDGLPTAGDFTYTGVSPVKYRRKHAPWTNWITTVTPVPANQLPPSVHQTFLTFPVAANYASLPAVSFVIPDQNHDMHDGSRLVADTWLSDNLGAYAAWAKTHNSLLIVTWDEDDYNGVNRIATIFYGAHLRAPGTNESVWTLHNITRTIEDMHGTTHSSRTGQVESIYGVFDTDYTPKITTLRQGLSSYAGVVDTFIHQDAPDAASATSHDLSADGDYGSATGVQPSQSLVRFDNLFGNGGNQVPAASTIISAKLLLSTGPSTGNDSTDRMSVNRMKLAWTDAATWNSLTAGVALDGVDAVAATTFTGYPDVLDGPVVFDVTDDVEAWRTGAANYGWVVTADVAGNDGWTFKSSEATTDVTRRPTLDITWLSPFQTWAKAYALAGNIAMPTSDTDGDNVNLMLEYAFGMNPTITNRKILDATNSAGLPLITRTGTTPANRVLQVEFLRRKNAAALGLTYTVQYGNTLTTFTDSAQPETVTSIDANWERVLVKDTATSPGTAKRFGRVKITLVP